MVNQELKTLGIALIEDLKAVLSDLPSEAIITKYEKTDYPSLKVTSHTFQITLGENKTLCVKLDKNMDSKL